MSASRHALKARYIFPVSGPPVPDGMITIEGERILAVGENLSGKPVTDLGNSLILPGLVNAHTHLEFSGLEQPLGSPGNGLPDWIAKVVAHRLSRDQPAAQCISHGLTETHRGGATSVGEIATASWPPRDDLLEADFWPKGVTAFREIIGLRPEQFDERLAAARAHLDLPWPTERSCRPGLSPHAPYSVHPDLLDRVVRLAKAANVPVAMHLAESREELELLAHGTGPFRQLLENLGVWSAEVFSGGRRPLDYLRRLAEAPRALAIHGNYLDREEFDFLAERRSTMSVVYCPRTHAYFRHQRYPLAEMLERGVNVALGTDSRASNPDLSMLNEMRFAAQSHPEIPPAKILEMATLAGARALGIDGEEGTIEPGNFANLLVLQFPRRIEADPFDLVLRSNWPIETVRYRGLPHVCNTIEWTDKAMEGP